MVRWGFSFRKSGVFDTSTYTTTLLERSRRRFTPTGFLHDLGDAYKQNRGLEAMRYMWPHRSLIDKGIIAPGHSDASICDLTHGSVYIV